jgi:FkbM family methyltransferase
MSDREGEAARYRVARAFARVVSVACLWKRKAAVELLLERRFGDVVEADGHLLRVSPGDRSLGARLRRRGVWSEAETELVKRELRPGMTVLDIGANIGYFTLLFARLVGPSGRVHAFEPEPENLELLRWNVEHNGYRNVTVVPAAVSRRRGVQELFKSGNNFGDHRLAHGAGGRASVRVEVITLDGWLADAGAKVDFVKMDIQGAECAALDGAHRLVRRSLCTLLTEFWPAGIRAFGDDPAAYLRELQSLGFAISIIEGRRHPVLRPLEGDADLGHLCTADREFNLFCRR